VDLHQLCEIELRRAQKLDLADDDIVQWVDVLSVLLDLLADVLGAELLGDELVQLDACSLCSGDLDHLATNSLHLLALSVRGLLQLILTTLSEANDEETDDITIGSLNIGVGLDQRLPLANQRSELIRSDIHAVEVGQTVLTLDLLNAKLELAEGVLLGVWLQIAKRGLEHTAQETIASLTLADSLGDNGLAEVTDWESVRGTDIVPLLLHERVDTLLCALLLLAELLVLTNLGLT